MPAVTYKEVPGFPHYRVGDDGSVWSQCVTKVNRGGWYELKGGIDKDGYRKLILCRDGQRRYVRLHNLVLEVFVRPRAAHEVGAHWDNDKLNNRLENLRWTTQQDNIDDKLRHGTAVYGSRHPNAKLTEDHVRAMRASLAAGVSRKTLAADFGVSYVTVCAIATRRYWRHILEE
jgi:hypothetical protein